MKASRITFTLILWQAPQHTQNFLLCPEGFEKTLLWFIWLDVRAPYLRKSEKYRGQHRFNVESIIQAIVSRILQWCMYIKVLGRLGASVSWATLGFGSGRDLMGCEIVHRVRLRTCGVCLKIFSLWPSPQINEHTLKKKVQYSSLVSKKKPNQHSCWFSIA